MSNKVLIFGGDGKLGTSFRKLLKDDSNYEVRSLTSKNLSYNDYQTVIRVIKAIDPDFIINCVGFTDVDGAEKSENKNLCLELNAVFPLILAMCGKIFGADVIHFSTDYVFDGIKEISYLETDIPNPVNYYGLTKMMGDQFIIKFDNVKIYRIQCVYSDVGKSFAKSILNLTKEQFQINVVGDQITVPTHADWIAKQIINLLPFPNYGLWNLVPDGMASYADFAKKILVGRTTLVHAVKSNDYPTPAKRPLFSVLDNSKIKAKFGLTFSDWQQVYDTYKT